MVANIQLHQLNDAQLTRFAELIYDTSGIRITAQKKMMLSNRIRRRLKANELHDFDEYFSLLKQLPDDHTEWDAFFQEVSTHETFLFRDEGHWSWFQTEYLPELARQARSGIRARSLRVWSAACSTGDEAYTIAACIAEGILDCGRWNVEIVGTDIGIGAVRKAQQAVFDERAMRLVPDSTCGNFFDALPNGKSWRAKSAISGWTSFRQHNLLDPLHERPFDLIFVKNVLIYFDTAAKKRVLANILPLLAPGGSLVTAAAEGVSGLIEGLEKQSPWLYRKPKTNEKR